MHSTPQLPSRSNTTARFLTSACAFVRVERLHRVGQAAHSVHDRDCGWGQEGLTGGYNSHEQQLQLPTALTAQR